MAKWGISGGKNVRSPPLTRQNWRKKYFLKYSYRQTAELGLTAVIDWYSRYVLSWRVSITLEGSFCIDVVDEALNYGCPEIFNTDQGSQYTTDTFTGPLLDLGIAISMDGKKRALDNIFVERLWRTVKYELIYLNDIISVRELVLALRGYFKFYNQRRLHQSLGYRTPAEVHGALGGCDNRKTSLRIA